MIGNNLLLGSGDEGYNLTRSLRFRSSASASLSRTPAVAGNRQIFTYSAWIKRGALDATFKNLFYAYVSTSDVAYISINSSNQLTIAAYNGGSFVGELVTTQVFRDPSAWYHIVIAVDTTQATASNRIKMYVNGSQITALATATYPPQNTNFYFNAQYIHRIAASDYPSSPGYFDGYIAEQNWIDGQALTPSSFGSTNSVTGVWQPARYTGTYGTNGFYLPFTDNSALTTSSNVGLGKDFSGNANYWVTNNISITAGVTYDSMTDVPTLTSATAANFGVMNSLSSSSNLTFSNANLATTYAAGTWNVSRASIGVTSGSWYWEVTAGGANNSFIGIANGAAAVTDALGANSNSAGWNFGGAFHYNGTTVGFGVTWTTGDVIGVAFNATTNIITFYKNGTVVNSGGTATAVTGGLYFPANSQSAGTFNINFGQRPFAYTPPTGFVALNTYNLPTSTIVKGNTVMDIALWSGNGSSQTITNSSGLKPDLVWVKARSFNAQHLLVDSVRGANGSVMRTLFSSGNGAEESTNTATNLTYGLISSINSNGLSVNTGSTNPNQTNASSNTYVAWQWQAGQGSSSSNTNGTITSTVSVNASAGFSVVTYTGTGANATVGHGLGVAPSWIIVKARNQAYNWNVYSASLANTQFLRLNTTDSVQAGPTLWNSTSPTSSVFSLGTSLGVNGSGDTHVAYCWTPIAGYSAFGSYTGNGSTDGVFVYTGFRPKYLLVKSSSLAQNWTIYDTSRNPYNAANLLLYPMYSNAEDVGTGQEIDLLSNGFKLRNSNANENSNGATYIYMAYAENPFKNALAR